MPPIDVRRGSVGDPTFAPSYGGKVTMEDFFFRSRATQNQVLFLLLTFWLDTSDGKFAREILGRIKILDWYDFCAYLLGINHYKSRFPNGLGRRASRFQKVTVTKYHCSRFSGLRISGVSWREDDLKQWTRCKGHSILRKCRDESINPIKMKKTCGSTVQHDSTIYHSIFLKRWI